MSQVLITGATGLVGGHLLRMLINEPKVNAIAAPTRRPLGDMPGVFNPHDPQLSDALAQVTDPIDIVFCCLGTTRREAGSKEAFIHADYTLVVDTALTGRRLGAPLFRLLPGNWKSIDARDVARVMLAESMRPEHEGVTILSSSELRKRAE